MATLFLHISTSVLLQILMSEIIPAAICAVIAIVIYLAAHAKNKKFMNEKLALQADLIRYKEICENVKLEKEAAQKETESAVKEKKLIAEEINRRIRTSMNGVIATAELLAQLDLNAEQKELIHTIKFSSEETIHSIEDIFRNTMGNKFFIESKNHFTKNNSAAESSKQEVRKISEKFAEKFPLKILVAEDDELNRQIAKKILNKLGYEPDFAINGKEALEIVPDKNYDIVFMDLLMPEMDGIEATKMIRLCLEAQPVIIAMTASVMDGDKEKCIEAGMNDYISKPVSIHELMNLLEKWFAVQIKRNLATLSTLPVE